MHWIYASSLSERIGLTAIWDPHSERDDAYIELSQCYLMDIYIIYLTMDPHNARDALVTFFNYGHHNHHHIMTYKAAYG